MKQFVNFVLVTFLVFASGVMWAEEANPASDFVYDLNEEGTGVVIKKYKGKAVDVVIPSVIEDFPVVNCNLNENETIVSVVLPDTCTQFKFYGCKSLEKVTFPKYLKYLPGEIGCDYYYGEYSYYNKYRYYNEDRYDDGYYMYDKMDVGVFQLCTALKEITLPQGLERIGCGAFGNSGLESIVIPDSVQSIEYGAFSGCTALTSVTIGNGVQSIENGAFSGCTALTTVTMGNSVQRIGYSAFIGCIALTSVTIGNGVQSIGEYAFDGCTALTSITIGNSVQSIGDGAFSHCSSLTTFNIGVEQVEYKYNRTLDNYYPRHFVGCSSLSLKEKAKVKKTGYTGSF